MKINIKTQNISLDRAIEEFVKEKIGSLEKFVNIIDNGKYKSPSGKIKSLPVAWVEIGKESRHHRSGPYFRAECQIESSGNRTRATARSKDLRQAIVEVKDELQRELKRGKKKKVSQIKRERRTLKEKMKLSPRARSKKGERKLQEGI